MGKLTYRTKYSRLNKRWYIQKYVTMRTFFGLIWYRTWVTQRDPWGKTQYFENEAAVEAFLNSKRG